MVRIDVPPIKPGLTLNALATVGGANTVNVPLAGDAEPAFPVVIAPVVLTYVAAVVLVTLTVTVHEPLAGIVPFDNATEVPPLVALTLPAPHDVAAPALEVLTNPEG